MELEQNSLDWNGNELEHEHEHKLKDMKRTLNCAIPKYSDNAHSLS